MPYRLHGRDVVSFGVYGFAGMRDYDGNISFNPRMPKQLERLKFPLTIRGQELEVDIGQESVTYLLRKGSELVITHQSEDIVLQVGVTNINEASVL